VLQIIMVEEMQCVLVKKVDLGLYASALDIYLSEASLTGEDQLC